MTARFWRSAAAGLVLAASGAAPVLAHHSFTMFDNQKTVTLEGTVKEFQWTNPHSWIEVAVKQPGGPEVEWSIEGVSSSLLAREGWSRTALKAGDKVVILMHPLKDGTNGGSLVSVTVDGKVLRAGG